MVWASPVWMPTTSTCAPASSTAFFGSVNSTCSVPTGARRIATLRPCNSLATLNLRCKQLLAMWSLYPADEVYKRDFARKIRCFAGIAARDTSYGFEHKFLLQVAYRYVGWWPPGVLDR